MPKRSEIEAAQLLLRLVEARNGDAPAWAVELANSEPSDEEPPSDIADLVADAYEQATSSNSGRFVSANSGRFTSRMKRANRVYAFSVSGQRVLRDARAGFIIERVVFDEDKEDATALRLYDDSNDFARLHPDDERGSK